MAQRDLATRSTRRTAPARRPTTGGVYAARLAIAYAVVASLWIVFSDQALEAFFQHSVPAWVQSAKGLFYVIATSAMLYALVRRYAAELSLAEGELRQILESIPDPVIVADLDGSIVQANRAAVRLLGSEIADAGGWPALRARLALPDGSPIDAKNDVLASALRGSVTVGWAARLRDATEPADLVISAAPVREDSTVRLAVAVLRDVSDIRRLERMRDEFLSTAAHELKTPIAAIKGYVQLLRRWAPDGHDAREKAAFDVLDRQCDRITRLIQELLEVSRMQLGELELHRERFDLAQVAIEVVGRARTLTGNAQLEVVIAESSPVHADRDRVEQVLLNLIENAIKYSPPQSVVATSVEAHDGVATVSVRDLGVGIPLDRREHLFEPFYLAHAGTSYHHQGGIGIGLYLCRRIVERHGGRIWFESQEGTGSTFHFSIPLAPGVADELRH